MNQNKMASISIIDGGDCIRQHIEGKCPFCRNYIRIPIAPQVDYECAHKESERIRVMLHERIKELEFELSKFIELYNVARKIDCSYHMDRLESEVENG